MISIIAAASRDAYPALLAGLQAQFGDEDSIEIATHFLEAEAAEFHWQSRVRERHLGTCESTDNGEDAELDRVAIMGALRHIWFVAECIVDGDGAVQAMHGLRLMRNAGDAQDAFHRMR
ncbi:hypothetical protein LZK98_17190 [Sphingomonas cannabina]|uniref:hypothetical protein n=1 Tax=Sphingomonas cannabina TaxID=2899123 RepID=UPI001F312D99|nr:hypothetical protein [Sphingomonas cannabina]UIJ44770.1 hypothetical protein LZK98_17190 [Sphingomonas cannabina]